MGCYNSKPQSNILNSKKFSSYQVQNQVNCGGKIGSDQFAKLGTKCDNNDIPNQDIENNQEDQNENNKNKQPYSTSKFLNEEYCQTNVKGEVPSSAKDKPDNTDEVEKSIVSIAKQQLNKIIEQEGFSEKINHINMIFNMLLQSQDEGFDHCSFDDPDLNDFMSGLQANSVISPSAAAARNINQLRRDTRGDTIIDIPSEKAQQNIQGIINTVLSSDYRLIVSPSQASIYNKQFQQDKVSQCTFSMKQLLTIATQDIGMNSPTSIDNTDQNKTQSSNQKQIQNNPISPPKISFTSNPGQSLAQSQYSSNCNNFSPRKNATLSIQQLQLFTICEERKGGEGQEDHFEQEEELQTNKLKIQQQNQIKREEVLKQKIETREGYYRQSTENLNQKKKSLVKNLSQQDVLGSTNSTTKTKNHTVIEKYTRPSLSELRKSLTPISFYHHQSNTLGQQSDQQAFLSLYRHSSNLNDISLQEIEQDFKKNPSKPQIQVSSLAIRSFEETK